MSFSFERGGMMLMGMAAAVLAAGAFGNAGLLDLATNSDALLPAAFVWEGVHHPESWRGFQWPRVPSLFPDLLLYGGLQALLGSWRLAQLIYAALSLAAMASLAGLVAGPTRQVTGGMAFLAVTGLVLGVEGAVDAMPWHQHLLAPFYHSGPFILSVACVLLAAGEARPGWGRLLGLALLAGLGTFSDRLFIGLFLVPLLAAVADARIRGAMGWKAAFLLAGAGLLGCALGVLADKAVFPWLLGRQPDVALLPGLMLQRGLAFFRQPAGWIALALDLSVLVPLLLWRPQGRERFLWVAASACAVPVTVLAAGLWEDDHSRRYLAPLLWWPILLHAPRLAGLRGMAGIGAVVAVLCGLAMSAGHLPGVNLLLWRDRLASCVLPTTHRAGLADYWVARRMTVSSDWVLQVAPVDRAGRGRVWGNNPHWLRASHADPQRPAPFSFIVMTDLDEASILARYGAPSGVLRCQGTPIWLYDDPAALHAALAAASPERVLPGASRCVGPDGLRSAAGALTPGPLRVDPARPSRKPTTWGPNLELPAGQWRVTLRYRLESGVAARWDVAGEYGGVILHSAPLPAAGAEIGVVSATVVLSRQMQGVEARSFVAGGGAIEVLGAAFEPADGAGGCG